jgi:hypothetical protein
MKKTGKRSTSVAVARDIDIDIGSEENPEEVPAAKSSKTVVESEKSRAARQAKREPPDVAALRNRKTARVRLRAIRLGYDGYKRIRQGAVFDYDAPVDAAGEVSLPTWAVMEKEYQAEPEVKMPPGMQPRVRGGASQGGVKPQDTAL